MPKHAPAKLANNCTLTTSLDEEKNGYVARDQLLYALDSCQEYQISHQREVTWEQGPMQGSRIDYITEKPYLHHQLGVPRAPIAGLLAAIS